MRRFLKVCFTLSLVVAVGVVIWWWRGRQPIAPVPPVTAPGPAAQAPAPPTAAPEVAPAAAAVAIAVPLSPGVAPQWEHTFDRLAYGMRWHGAQPPELAAFRDWSVRYQAAATAAARAALETEGVALATIRRPVMRELIESDPERALELTVPATVRAALPAMIVAQLEARVSGMGTLAVVPVEPTIEGGTAEEHEHDHAEDRFVRLNGVSYVAHTYGRRRAQATEDNASLHGVALDDQIAVHASPLRVLDVGEPPVGTLEPLDPATGLPIGSAPPTVNSATPTLVEFHGRWWALADSEMLDRVERSLRALETLPGPVGPLFEPGRLIEPPVAAAAPTAWTTGTKKLLVLRVDFSDVVGEPRQSGSNVAITQTYAQNVVNNEVRPFYVEGSYDQTTLTTTVSSRVYRLPKTAATYATAYDLMGLYDDAVTAARSNHNADNFDLVQIVFSYLGPSRITGSKFGFAGVAFRGGKQSFINGYYEFDVVAHELGHNYGLAHANLWSNYGDPISRFGTSQEYGDTYDVMGGRQTTVDRRHHFNPWFKNRLGWLPDSAVTLVSTSGTYRVHRFDAQTAPRTHPLALNVFRDGCRSYWISNRRNIFTAMAVSAYVQWGFYSNQQSQLLDLNSPGSELADAGLAVGATLSDAGSGVTLRNAAQGGTAPSEYLDIEVTVTPPARNLVAHWGEDDAVKVPLDLRDIVAIAAGDEHGLALKRNGELVTWGEIDSEGPNRFGELYIPWQPFDQLASFTAGGDSSGFVLKDGTVRVWGIGDFGQNNIPAGLGDVKQLALGGDHALALKNDGTVVAWGSNEKGQISVPAGLTGVKALSAGRDMTLALLDNGTVLHWGINAAQLPNDLTNVIAIAAGWGHGVALRSDGTVSAWGDNADGQATVPAGLANVKQIGAGHLHSVALKTDGTIVAWGNNDLDQVIIPRGMPVIDAIAVAENHVMGLILGTNAPYFSWPLQDVSVALGEIFSLEARVESIPPVTYRWQRMLAGTDTWADLSDGDPFSGVGTQRLYVFSNPPMSGDRFRCVVTDGENHTITSSVATLAVTIPPTTIYSQPAGPTIRSGETGFMYVSVNGPRRPTFRWQRRLAGSADEANWFDLEESVTFSGVRSGQLYIQAAYSMNGDEFRCWAGNGGYTLDVVSASARLTVLARNHAISQHPADREVTIGNDAAFSVVATGEPDFTYFWQRLTASAPDWADVNDGAGISGATTGTLLVTGVAALVQSGDQFRCIVHDAAGQLAVSAGGTLTIAFPAPSATFPPWAIGATAHGSMTLHAPLIAGWNDVQWRHNGIPVAGATGSTLTLADLGADDDGFYDVVLSNGAGASRISHATAIEVKPQVYADRMRVNPNFHPRFEAAGGDVRVMAVAGDGAIYIAGQMILVDGQPRPQIARLRPDGSLDPTFVAPPLGEGQVLALLPMHDGGVVIGGWFSSLPGVARGNIARLRSDGAVDQSFDLGTGIDGLVSTLALDRDGRILVGGSFSRYRGQAREGLVRLNADGSLDPSLRHILALPLQSVTVYDLLPLSDGSIVAGGWFANSDGSVRGVVRFLPDGAIDPAFSAPAGHPVNTVAKVVGLPDGKLMLALRDRNGVARLEANGALDPGFVYANDYLEGAVVGVQGNAVIVASSDDTNGTGRIRRLTNSGGVDPTFVGPTDIDRDIRALAVLDDGRILTAGAFGRAAATVRNCLLRLDASGGLDPDFAPNIRDRAGVSAILPMEDGGWIVGGWFTHVDDVPCPHVARLRADGSLDPAFHGNLNFGNGVTALSQLPDGQLVAGTAVWTSTPNPRSLAAIDRDGTTIADFALRPGFPPYSGAEVRVLEPLPSGRFLMGGKFTLDSPTNQGALVRLFDDGRLDRSFRHDFYLYNASVDAVARASDGRLWVAGYGLSSSSNGSYGLARLLEDGARDASFHLDREFYMFPRVLQPLGDDRLLVGGSGGVYAGSQFRAGVLRFNSNGTFDSSFDPGFTNSDYVSALTVQTDGRILVGGVFGSYRGVSRPHLLRLKSDGELDAAFQVEDWTAFADTAAVNVIRALPGGGLLLGGSWFEIGSFTGRGLVLLESADAPPNIVAQPIGQTVSADGGVQVSAVVDSFAAAVFQWQLDGADIAGATAATYAVPSAQAFHSGQYAVVVRNAGGTVTSAPVTIEVDEPPPSGARLTNLSTRALALTGDNVLIPGFVVEGPGNKQLLIRAVGPTLGGFGVAGTLPDPRLTLKRWNPALPPNGGYEDVEVNDDWGTNPNAAAIIAKSAELLAFPLDAGSVDAALLVDLVPGQYSVVAGDAGTATGIAIVELYDADSAPSTGSGQAGSTSRLINISNRGYVGTGDSIMIPGFVVSDEGPKTLLIRVIGPTLGTFGVPDVLADPTLSIYRHDFTNNTDELILTNDDWSTGPGAARTRDVAVQVLAFPLPEGSKDAAFVVTLNPGVYTVHARGTNDTTGVALVEVYAVP